MIFSRLKDVVLVFHKRELISTWITTCIVAFTCATAQGQNDNKFTLDALDDIDPKILTNWKHDCCDKLQTVDHHHYKLIIDLNDGYSQNFAHQIIEYKNSSCSNKYPKIIHDKPAVLRSLKRGIPLTVWIKGWNEKYHSINVVGNQSDLVFSKNSITDSKPTIPSAESGIDASVKNFGSFSAGEDRIKDAQSIILNYYHWADYLQKIYRFLNANVFKLSNCGVTNVKCNLEAILDSLPEIDRDTSKWLSIIDSQLTILSDLPDPGQFDNAKQIAASAQQALFLYTGILHFEQRSMRKLDLESHYQIQDNDYIEFTPKYRLASNKEVEVTAPGYKYYIKGGFAMSVSTGFIIHGLTNFKYHLRQVEIFDTTYFSNNGIIDEDSILNVSSQQKNQIRNGTASDETDDREPFNIGISTNFNFYVRTGTIVTPALNVGVGFDIDDDAEINVRLLTGGSLILGQRVRFLIHTGMLFGKVDVLGQNHRVGDYLDSSITEVPKSSEWDRSWYVGISANFPIKYGGDKSKQNKQPSE